MTVHDDPEPPITILEDTPLPISIDVLANDTIQGVFESLHLLTPPEHGTVTISTAGFGLPKFIYMPEDGYCGPDTFFYTAKAVYTETIPTSGWRGWPGYARVDILAYCPPIPSSIVCSDGGLSHIGQAVVGAIGQGDYFSQHTCHNEFEGDWILDVPDVKAAETDGRDYFIQVADMIRETEYAFSFSVLRVEPGARNLLQEYLAPAISDLHDNTPAGDPYPLLRFAYSEPIFRTLETE